MKVSVEDTCIGCGACVAACKNASASLFVSAKVSQLASLPQGQPEREKRVVAMVDKMDEEGFGHCTNTGACEAECPKEISQEYIRKMNWSYRNEMWGEEVNAPLLALKLLGGTFGLDEKDKKIIH